MSWQPLFSLQVEHTYFPGGVCRDLRLVPTAATQRLLQKSGCIFRPTERGLLVAFDATTRHALVRRAEDDDEPFAFRFLAHGPDASFANYTDGAIGSQQSLLVFDNRVDNPTGRGDGTGRWMLQPRVAPIDELGASGVLSQPECRVPPHFVVDLLVTADALDETRHYGCRLQARETVWKYCLCGELAEQPDELRVVDLAQGFSFDAAVDERLPDGRPVRAVRSRTPIALQERSPQRFQLRGDATGSDKVLIKRLPVASPAQLNRETLGGVLTWVSEIYVHR
jgi:hypothetical protein